jgi:Na+-transporting methylmalonyl-CoA/oxaloacetate decarboxylase beta subunit
LRLEQLEHGTLQLLGQVCGGVVVTMTIFVLVYVVTHLVYTFFGIKGFQRASKFAILGITLGICAIYTNDNMTPHVLGVWLATSIAALLTAHSLKS